MGNLILKSSAFSEGQEIPKKHGYKYENKNPHLKISNIPSNARSLALIMDDPDAKAAVGKIWVHWVIWNIDPTTNEIPEGTIPNGSVEGTSDFGEIGYGGPAPPDKSHTYFFKIYALDSKLDLPKGSNKMQLEEAIKGHVVSEAVLTGTFAP